MGHATLLRRLLPPASYDPNGTRIAVPLGMEGAELDRVLADAPHAVGALRPFTYQEWLEDYERVYGLPDVCLKDGALYQDRLGFIALALRERGHFDRLARPVRGPCRVRRHDHRVFPVRRRFPRR